MDRFSCFNFCFLIWDYPCNHWDKKIVLPFKKNQEETDNKARLEKQCIYTPQKNHYRGKQNLLVCSNSLLWD